MNKIVAFVVVLAVILGGWYMVKHRNAGVPEVEAPVINPGAESTVSTGSTTPSSTSTSAVSSNPSQPVQPTSQVKSFTVSGENYSMTPKTLSVNKGDKVRITFKNINGMHDLKIDEFNVATPRIAGGQEATVEFTADKTGAFVYYCSVGSHRAQGMWGTLTVK